MFEQASDNAAVRHGDGVPSDRVSAIVVTYFTGPILARVIQSLREQPAVSEIILIDNGNWDGAVAQAIGERRVDPEIKVFSGHGNIGFAAACNLGARTATGDYLLFLNPDAVMPDGGVQRLMQDASRLARPWLISPKLVGPDGIEQQGSRRATLTPWRAFVEATRLYRFAPHHPYFRRFNLHTEPCPPDLTPAPVISGACFLLPRDDYFSIGGMDEAYFLHVEDVDFCLRFVKAGGTVYFDPHVSVLHFKSSSRVDPIAIRARKTSSMIRYFRTHFSDTYPRLALHLIAASLWMLFGVAAVARIAARSIGFLQLRARRGRAVVRRARDFAQRRSRR